MSSGPTWDVINERVGRLMADRGEWCGVPLPIKGMRLTVEPRNPHAAMVARLQEAVDADGARDDEDEEDEGLPDGWVLVNEWWSRRLRRTVGIVKHGTTGEQHAVGFRYDYVHKTRLLLDTLVASQIWPLDAELTAMDTLAGLLKPHLYEAYLCTGTFLESSPRSGLTYIFRRLRPTLVYNGRTQRLLAALCLHPIGYYEQTHAGAMVPTDDVIAHLLMMRADEPFFWRRANQHSPDRPEAGL